MQESNVADLDDVVLHAIFSKLDGQSLGRAATVSTAWRDVISDSRLWESVYQELEAEGLRRMDILADIGGDWKELFKWRHRVCSQKVNRLCVETAGQGSVATELVTVRVTATLPEDSGCEAQPKLQLAFSDPRIVRRVEDGRYNAQNLTWSPHGECLAFCGFSRTMSSFRSEIVLANAEGRQIGVVALEQPFPPFYLQWSPCGTYLALLSNWHGRTVALRVIDVAPLLLSGHLAAKAGHTSGGQAAAARVSPQLLLEVAQPLFLTWAPDSARLLLHTNCNELKVVEVAEVFAQARQPPNSAAEASGTLNGPAQEPPSDPTPTIAAFAAAIAAAGPGPEARRNTRVLYDARDSGEPYYQAPIWAADAKGGDVALVAVPNVLDGPSIACICIPPPPTTQQDDPPLGNATTERREVVAVGISSNSQSLHFVAGRGWLATTATTTGGTGFRNEVWVMPLDRQEPVIRAFPPADDHEPQHEIEAMQWSPDGRSLLFLVKNMELSIGRSEPYQWCVWQSPSLDGSVGPAGRLFGGTKHALTRPFVDHYLPFFDQYNQTMQLWSPDSRAFCYTAYHAPEGLEGGRMPTVNLLEDGAVPSLRDTANHYGYGLKGGCVLVQPITPCSPSSGNGDGVSSTVVVVPPSGSADKPQGLCDHVVARLEPLVQPLLMMAGLVCSWSPQ